MIPTRKISGNVLKFHLLSLDIYFTENVAPGNLKYLAVKKIKLLE